ncbi:uncharacterized protein LOC119739639 isoform X1 [Patiria miniata]|uniref:Uncharacterized protein n=1 Tax=Patiria miniata TaxID=46514 RepID=A0A914B2K6_PATMI|nr:uncharacterized protein LOC119739639 isoform X1 [Patiria miniata]
MADMRLVVLATILLTLILTGEIQRCSGQIHYKVPGWGPGGKRSSVLAGSNVLRKRHWRLDSQLEEVSTEKQHQLALLQHIAKSLAQKFVAPTLSDTETVRDQLTANQWREAEDNDRQNDWN